MVIGVPKEIKDGENRVGMTPAGVTTLCRRGHRLLVEVGAGLGSGMEDDEYRAAGAQVVPQASQAWSADLVVKVKEPLPAEYPLLRPGLVLFTYLHLASSEGLTRALLERGVVGIGYETVQTEAGALPLLTPMSEIAGKMSVQVGAHYLQAGNGGRGLLLGGVPGVPPAEVVILGGGVVGINAVKVAMGMGAHVTVLDVNHDRLRHLDDLMHGKLTTVYSNPYTIERSVLYADLVIGAVLVPGARAPKLVSKETVARMRKGAVIADVAVDQGGCVETIRPTSHSQPTYQVDGIIHYAVPNIPAAVPRTATHALANATLPYLVQLADLGAAQAARESAELARGVNVAEGRVVHPGVAEAFALPRAPWPTGKA